MLDLCAHRLRYQQQQAIHKTQAVTAKGMRAPICRSSAPGADGMTQENGDKDKEAA
jgi:hypothetical protein